MHCRDGMISIFYFFSRPKQIQTASKEKTGSIQSYALFEKVRKLQVIACFGRQRTHCQFLLLFATIYVDMKTLFTHKKVATFSLLFSIYVIASWRVCR